MLQNISPYAIIAAAVLLDLLLGDPRWLQHHPVVYIGKLITLLETVLRRVGLDGRVGGIILLVVTVVLTVCAAAGLINGFNNVFPWTGFAVSVFFSYACLAARSLHVESKKVADALAAGDLPQARILLSQIVGRDTEQLEEPEIWRALVETVAENTSDGVVAPLFYLMIGGPLLALAYKAVNTLDSMVGYQNEKYINFGWASARFDDIVNFIPARITGLLMGLVAPLVGLSAGNALSMMRSDGRNHSSPNSGMPEAAAAGALGVQLGGTNSYFGKPVVKPTIGVPGRPLSLAAWRGAVRLMYGAEALLVLLWFVTVILTTEVFILR